TRYHTPLSPRSTLVGCMRRLASTSPCAACKRAHVDLAMSSLLTDAICTRQPPEAPDMPSIRLAMLGAGSLVEASGGACVMVGCLSVAGAGGGVGPLPLPGVAAGWLDWIGVGVLAASASGLGAAGAGRPLAGSLGVEGPASSFSGCTGTALGAMRL